MMDSNYETIKSLVSLLVRKSGFNIDENVASLELEKTENLIKSYEEDLVYVSDPEEKEMMERTLSQLREKREAWKVNSEIVGKTILKKYIDKEDINSIKNELEILKNNASCFRTSGESLMSYIYREIFVSNKKITQLEEKIKGNKYYKKEDKEIDESLIEYLTNKINDYDKEIENIDIELNKFKDLEIKDVNALNKIKKYELEETKNLEKVDKLFEISNQKNASIELWEKVNNIKSKLTEKQDIIKNYVNKLEDNLKFIRDSHIEYSNKKKKLTEEVNKFRNLLIGASEKISKNDYFDYASKMIDENELELTKEKINELNNKKEVIYVDVNEIIEEIKKEWNKKSFTSYYKEYDKKREDDILIDDCEEDIIIVEDEIEAIYEARKEEENKKNKIELEW